MRILQVAQGFPPHAMGGVETLTFNLSRELSMRHDVHVFYPVKKADGKAEMNSKKVNEITVHEVILPLTYLDRLRRSIAFNIKDERTIQYFKNLLVNIRPDIVHFQHLIGLPTALPSIASRWAAVVLTLNDYWFMCCTAHFLRWNGEICRMPTPHRCSECLASEMLGGLPFVKKRSIPCRRLMVKSLSFGRGREYKERWDNARSAFNNVDRIVPISNSILSKAREFGLISDEAMEKVTILYPGVEVTRLNGVEKKNSELIRFGFLGTLNERKGAHVAVEAFRSIYAEEAQLLIYNSPDPQLDYQRRLMKRAGEVESVRFMGRFQDVREPYSNIDVIIVPSTTYEGFGLVVQEAFAASIPVIATDIGALNEFVHNGVNGLLFKPSDYQDLARKVRMIVDDPSILDRLRNNIPMVKSIEKWAQEYEAIYKEAIDRYEERRDKVSAPRQVRASQIRGKNPE